MFSIVKNLKKKDWTLIAAIKRVQYLSYLVKIHILKLFFLINVFKCNSFVYKFGSLMYCIVLVYEY